MDLIIPALLIGFGSGAVTILWIEWAIDHTRGAQNVSQWLTRRRETAADEWAEHARLARLLSGAPIGSHADHYARKARRRLARWDTALDLWTRHGTRRT